MRRPLLGRARRPAVVALATACVLSGCRSSKSGSSGASGTRPAITNAPTTSISVPSGTPPTGDLQAAMIRLTEVTAGLDKPVAMAARHGTTTLYVANQVGDIRAIVDGRLAPQRVLDLRGHVTGGNEQGLLGLTFSPDGTHLYVDFTDLHGDSHVQEFAMKGAVADPSTRRELLFQRQPFPNHNGGEVLTGPDGMLYIGFGDGGAGGDPMDNGQDKSVLLGKILRIDPRASRTGAYSVPADNPFVSTPRARPEIWQWGLRNPWRFSFDRATGDLWIGDVGQNAYEEIDFAKAGTGGLNFGWSRREGLHKYKGNRPAGAVDPVYEYSHADGGVAVTGGYVYRGKRIPDLVGAYVFTDYSQGRITALEQHGGRIGSQSVIDVSITTGISSFGEDNAGELYVLDLAGKVWRIDPAS